MRWKPQPSQMIRGGRWHVEGLLYIKDNSERVRRLNPLTELSSHDKVFSESKKDPQWRWA